MFRILTGSIIILGGVWFLYMGITESLVFLINAVFAGAIGAAIVLNKKEDVIEDITRDDNHSKK